MIHLAFPWVPPSVNDTYETGRNGRRHLSTEARRFENETPAHLLRFYRQEMIFFNDKKDTQLTVAAIVFLTKLENKGFPEKKGVARYKKLDTTNRIKFLEDALAKAAGVDDSQNFTVALQKRQGAEEKTHLWVWAPEKEESPFDAVFRSLMG